MKALIKITVLLLLSIGSYFGYQLYEEQKKQDYIDNIVVPIKNTSLRTIEHINLIGNNESSITFGEYFQKSTSDIKAIDENILEARTHFKDSYSEINNLALDYMKQCQEIIRINEASLRSKFSINSDLSTITRQIEEMRSTENQYTFDRLKKSSEKLMNDLKASQEKITEHRTKSLSALTNLRHTTITLSTNLPSTSTLTLESIDEAIAAHTKEIKE